MVSVIWKKRALPIYWLLLSKKGSSNFYEQMATIRPVLRLLKEYDLVVIGDREYRGTALALWLTKKRISFVLRLNKNTLIKPKYQKYQALNTLSIQPGERSLYPKVKVTESAREERFNVVVYWRRKYKNKQRLTNLILLIAIAYTASCLTGLKIRNTGYQEYINRLKIEVRNALRRKHLI